MKKVILFSVLLFFMSCGTREFNSSASSEERFIVLTDEYDRGMFFHIVLDRTTGQQYLVAGFPGSGYGITSLNQ